MTSRRHCHKAEGIHLEQGGNDTYPRSQGPVIPTLAVSALDHLVVIFSLFSLSVSVDVKTASVQNFALPHLQHSVVKMQVNFLQDFYTF